MSTDLQKAWHLIGGTGDCPSDEVFVGYAVTWLLEIGRCYDVRIDKWSSKGFSVYASVDETRAFSGSDKTIAAALAAAVLSFEEKR